MITSAITPGTASGPDPVAERAGTAPRGARFVGLAIACLFPAVLWGELIAAITTWVGAPLARLTIATVVAAIAVFLYIICAPLQVSKMPSRFATGHGH